MSRRPATPRLAELDPVSVADEACSIVGDYVRRIAAYLGDMDPEIHSRSTSLWEAAHEATCWAQGLHVDERLVHEHLLTLSESLWTRAADGAVSIIADDELGDSAIATVMRACLCRLRLDGESVTVGQLAALASVDVRRVQQLVAEGRLRKGGHGEVEAESARAWLAERKA
jgi:hypothetical protein